MNKSEDETGQQVGVVGTEQAQLAGQPRLTLLVRVTFGKCNWARPLNSPESLSDFPTPTFQHSNM